MLPANFKLTHRLGKSFTDDLVESGDCKRESSLVLRSAEIFPGFLDLFFPVIFKISGFSLGLLFGVFKFVNFCDDGGWCYRADFGFCL